jgi:hypothetical protein
MNSGSAGAVDDPKKVLMRSKPSAAARSSISLPKRAEARGGFSE